MTRRTYGSWPGWLVEAGWSEEIPGYYCTVSCFDGEHETNWDLGFRWEPASLTEIEEWVHGLAQTFRSILPPPDFFKDLEGDNGREGFYPTVKYS